MFDFSSRTIRWGALYFTSLAFFALILLFSVLNPLLATVLSFALLALWSRIPCMTNDITKDLEVIDLFTILLAINIGRFWGGLFGFSLMLFSRFYNKGESGGYSETPLYTVSDALLLFLVGLFAPEIYALVGNSLVFSLYVSTAIRYVLGYSFLAVFFPSEFFYWFRLIIPALATAYAANTLAALVLGDYVSGLLKNGLSVPWGLALLFFVVLAVATLLRFIGKHAQIEVERKHFKTLL